MEWLSELFTGTGRLDFLDLGPGSANKSGALVALIAVGAWWFFLVAWAAGEGKEWSQRLLALGGLPLVASLFISAVAGYLLLRTESRGGLVALAVGYVALITAMGRAEGKWRPHRNIVLGACLLAVFGMVALYLWGPGDRFLALLKGEDSSASIRVDLYGAGLLMLGDAPGGWGTGMAGDAFRHWYQEPGPTLHYLSLVNSHLTWMVEQGVWFQIFYMAGWGLVFGYLWVGRNPSLCDAKTSPYQGEELREALCDAKIRRRPLALLRQPAENPERGNDPAGVGLPSILFSWRAMRRHRRSNDVDIAKAGQDPLGFGGAWEWATRVTGFAVWLTLAVTAIFSSVLTWPGLWVLPGIFLLAALSFTAFRMVKARFLRKSGEEVYFSRGRVSGIHRRNIAVSVSVAMALLVCLHIVSWLAPREVRVQAGREGVMVGNPDALVAVIVSPDESVLGNQFGQLLRETLPEGLGIAVSHHPDAKLLTQNGPGHIVFSGRLPEYLGDLAGEAWLFLNPSEDLPLDWEERQENMPPIRVVIGSMSPWQQRMFWEGLAEDHPGIELVQVAGAGSLISRWPDYVYE